jgi:hypothetical protein
VGEELRLRHGRFPEWELGVLAPIAGTRTARVIETVREWQEASDGDSETVQHIRDEVLRLFKTLGEFGPLSPERVVVRFSAAAITRLMSVATGERHSTNGASSALRAAAVPELRYTRTRDRRNWCWHGADAAPDTNPTHEIHTDNDHWSVTPLCGV